jgi:TRAP-type uncharacterized transport system fused permease subunit
METGLLHLHSILRWVILVLLLVSIYTTFTATNSNNKKFWLFTLITAHITLLIGLYQTFNYWNTYVRDANFQMSDVMKSKGLRFFLVEHPLMMVISIVLITLAYRSTKILKYKKAGILFLIALIIILAAVPWPFRELVGRPWFPAMG